MRKAFGVVIAFAVVACGKAAPTESIVDEISGVLNGQSYAATPDVRIISRPGKPDSLFIGGVRRPDPKVFFEQEIDVMTAVSGPGRYPLCSRCVHFLTLVGGDGIIGDYSGDSTNAGTLIVTEYNGVGGVFKAELEFDANVFANRGRVDAEWGTNVAFRTGNITVARLRKSTYDTNGDFVGITP